MLAARRLAELRPWIKRPLRQQEIEDVVLELMTSVGGADDEEGSESKAREIAKMLADLPLWATKVACLRFGRGEVKAEELGEQRLRRGYVPSSAHVHMVAAALVKPIYHEAMELWGVRRRDRRGVRGGRGRPAERLPREPRSPGQAGRARRGRPGRASPHHVREVRMPFMPNEMMRCFVCARVRPRAEFKKRNATGHHGRCHACRVVKAADDRIAKSMGTTGTMLRAGHFNGSNVRPARDSAIVQSVAFVIDQLREDHGDAERRG